MAHGKSKNEHVLRARMNVLYLENAKFSKAITRKPITEHMQCNKKLTIANSIFNRTPSKKVASNVKIANVVNPAVICQAQQGSIYYALTNA